MHRCAAMLFIYWLVCLTESFPRDVVVFKHFQFGSHNCIHTVHFQVTENNNKIDSVIKLYFDFL